VHIVPIEWIMGLVLLIYACVVLTLRIGFLDDGDRLHGSTVPCVILVVEVIMFID
jgi:hypothetical protein